MSSDENSRWLLQPDTAETVLDEGYAICPQIISPNAIKNIEREIAPWLSRAAINSLGSLNSSGDILLQNLGIYSPSSLKLAVNPEILDVMERIFGMPAVLNKLECRQCNSLKGEMPWHCDLNRGVSIFIFLQGVSNDTGSTTIIPRSHELGNQLNEGYLQVPDHVLSEHLKDSIGVAGGPGVGIIYDEDIWHKRTETLKIGRQLLWFGYLPRDSEARAVNLIVRQSSIFGLDERQRKAIGFSGTSALRAGGSEDFVNSRAMANLDFNLVPVRTLLRALPYRGVASLKDAIKGIFPRKFLAVLMKRKRKKLEKKYWKRERSNPDDRIRSRPSRTALSVRDKSS